MTSGGNATRWLATDKISNPAQSASVDYLHNAARTERALACAARAAVNRYARTEASCEKARRDSSLATIGSAARRSSLASNRPKSPAPSVEAWVFLTG